MPVLLLRTALFELEGDFCPVCQPLQRLRKINALILHDEREHVAPLLAAKAFEDLQMRINTETGRLLLVKRTQRGEIRPCPLQRQIRSNDIHDIARRPNLFPSRVRNQHSPSSSTRFSITQLRFIRSSRSATAPCSHTAYRIVLKASCC